MTPQRINGWEARGVSKQGAIEAQRVLGCSALWITDEVGPMNGAFNRGVSPTTELGAFELAPNERELITDFRVLPEDDQTKFANEIAQRASTMRKYLREQFLKMKAETEKHAVNPAAQSANQEKARKAMDLLSKSSLDPLISSGNAVVENPSRSHRKRS